jgi:IS5 family transposase
VRNPLTVDNNTTSEAESQASLGKLVNHTPLSTELDEIFNCIPYQRLIKTMENDKSKKAFSPLGRPNYPYEMMLKAYLAGYILGVRSTNDIIRRLQENPILAIVCGFDITKQLPHRTTFNRFFNKLIRYQHLVDDCLSEVTTRLGEVIPDFGKVVAIDATAIRSHANLNKRPSSDPEAGFAYKGGKKDAYHWEFGYYLHMVADATSELPIAKQLSLSSQHEKEIALPLLRKTRNELPWFNPEAVLADAGYDAYYVYEDIVNEFDAEPIIDSSKKKSPLLSGSTQNPICPGGLPLIRIGYHPMLGFRYECPARARKSIKCPLSEMCPLKVAYVRPGHDYRRFGYRISRTSSEWQELYNKRTAIERMFSRLKDKRRLNSHCFRGFSKINLHCTLSVLVMQAMALSRVKAGQVDDIRACARKIF